MHARSFGKPCARRVHPRVDAPSEKTASRVARGFTLIEILVVVAIIALLVAILLPSLARARAQARLVQCQSNLHQLGVAFCMYATADNKGRLPGFSYDPYADWLGRRNKDAYTTTIGTGREPEDGVIYKYMGKNKQAYTCPDDDLKVLTPAAGSLWPINQLRSFSYSLNIIIDGAKVEQLVGAHHPLKDFANNDHRASPTRPMKAFEGVPMLMEEDGYRTLWTWPEGGWAYTDGIVQRHFRNSPVTGYGCIAFTDGHAGKVQLPPGDPGVTDWFSAYDHCVRKSGGTWVNGNNDPGATYYGYIDHAKDASAYGITH